MDDTLVKVRAQFAYFYCDIKVLFSCFALSWLKWQQKLTAFFVYYSNELLFNLFTLVHVFFTFSLVWNKPSRSYNFYLKHNYKLLGVDKTKQTLILLNSFREDFFNSVPLESSERLMMRWLWVVVVSPPGNIFWRPFDKLELYDLAHFCCLASLEEAN